MSDDRCSGDAQPDAREILFAIYDGDLLYECANTPACDDAEEPMALSEWCDRCAAERTLESYVMRTRRERDQTSCAREVSRVSESAEASCSTSTPGRGHEEPGTTSPGRTSLSDNPGETPSVTGSPVTRGDGLGDGPVAGGHRLDNASSADDAESPHFSTPNACPDLWEWDGDCSLCHASLEWQGDQPETEDDAICHACAWAELTKLRAKLQVALDDTFRLRMERAADEELPVGPRDVDRSTGPGVPAGGGDARGVDVHGAAPAVTPSSSKADVRDYFRCERCRTLSEHVNNGLCITEPGMPSHVWESVRVAVTPFTPVAPEKK